MESTISSSHFHCLAITGVNAQTVLEYLQVQGMVSSSVQSKTQLAFSFLSWSFHSSGLCLKEGNGKSLCLSVSEIKTLISML